MIWLFTGLILLIIVVVYAIINYEPKPRCGCRNCGRLDVDDGAICDECVGLAWLGCDI